MIDRIFAKGILGMGLFAFALSHSTQAFEVSFETDHHLPLVYLNVVSRAGYVTDPKGQSGITNFLGETLLRGTKKLKKSEIDTILDRMGARLEVEARAEALIFRGAVLSSQLEPFLALLKEILSQPSFPEREIKKLKSEIISALQEELGHDPSLASKKFTEFLFQNHPYGKSTLGKQKDISGLTQAQLRAHYQKIFKEKYLLVVGSGDASSDRIEKWAEDLSKTYNPGQSLSHGSVPVEIVRAPVNPPKRRLLIVDKPDRTQTQIDIGQIGITMKDPQFFPVHIANHAFGGPSFSSTLMQEIRVKRGWSYGANSALRFGLQPRSWQVHFFPASTYASEALAYGLKLIENLKKDGITKQQFAFSKTSLINNSGFLYNTPKKRVENKLLEKTLDLPEDFMKSFGSELQKVDFEKTNHAIQNFLKPEHVSISVLATAGKSKEAFANAAGVSVENVEVVPYTKELH